MHTQSILSFLLATFLSTLAAVWLSSPHTSDSSAPILLSTSAMSATMRSVLHNPQGSAVDELRIGESEKPQVRADHIVIRVKAFGLNRADLLQREGQLQASGCLSPTADSRAALTVHALPRCVL